MKPKPKQRRAGRETADRSEAPHTIGHTAAALKQRARQLLRLPGVLGAAVGFRLRKGLPENEPVITVFVEYGLKRRRISKVPSHRRIPRELRVRLRGKIRVIPLDLVPSLPGRLHQGSQTDVPTGEAVSNQRSSSNAGTLGWVARLADRRPVVCGACHVLLRLQQSRFVGGVDKTFVFSDDDPELIAIRPSNGGDSVSGYVISGRRGGPLDAAVALLEDGTPTRTIPGLGPMGSLRYLTPDDLVFPRGPRVSMRVSRGALPDGKVTRYPAQMTFRYDDTPDGMVIEDLIETDLATAPGDSGGLLVDEDIRPLGMLLGAANGRSYFIHLRNVVRQFRLMDL